MGRSDEPAAPAIGTVTALPFLPKSPFERLFERRILFLRGELTPDTASETVAGLLTLDDDSNDDVHLYIDSPGGVMTGMFAVHDVIATMRATVHTRCVGLAASAGGFLLATGTGTRSATRNARIMLHQPLGGVRGTAADITIQARESHLARKRMEELLAGATGQPVERIHADLDRDHWMSAEEARAYGVVDEVVPGR